jgi:hypothetical protein
MKLKISSVAMAESLVIAAILATGVLAVISGLATAPAYADDDDDDDGGFKGIGGDDDDDDDGGFKGIGGDDDDDDGGTVKPVCDEPFPLC